MNCRRLVAGCALVFCAVFVSASVAGGRIHCRQDRCDSNRAPRSRCCLLRFHRCPPRQIVVSNAVCPTQEILRVCDEDSQHCLCLFNAGIPVGGGNPCDPCTYFGPCQTPVSCGDITHCLAEANLGGGTNLTFTPPQFTALDLQEFGIGFDVTVETPGSGVTMNKSTITFDDPETISTELVQANLYKCTFTPSEGACCKDDQHCHTNCSN